MNTDKDIFEEVAKFNKDIDKLIDDAVEEILKEQEKMEKE